VLDGACEQTSCVDDSTNARGIDEQVRFAALADQEVRIVVDGFVAGGSLGVSTYTLSVTCDEPGCTPSGTVVGCATLDLPGNNGQTGSTAELLTYGCGGDASGRSTSTPSFRRSRDGST
jgi:hypothetical protein